MLLTLVAYKLEVLKSHLILGVGSFSCLTHGALHKTMENRSFTLIKVYIRWTQSEVKCISKVSSPYTRRPHPRELGTPAGAKAADWALLLCTRPYPV